MFSLLRILCVLACVGTAQVCASDGLGQRYTDFSILKQRCDIWQSALAAEYSNIFAKEKQFEGLYEFVIRDFFTGYSDGDLGNALFVCKQAYQFEKKRFDRYIEKALGRDSLDVVLSKHERYLRITTFIEKIELLIMFIVHPKLGMLCNDYEEIVQTITTTKEDFARYYSFVMKLALRNVNYQEIKRHIASCEKAPQFIHTFLAPYEQNNNSVARIMFFNKQLLAYLYSLEPV